jgi:hypothetical protein
MPGPANVGSTVESPGSLVFPTLANSLGTWPAEARNRFLLGMGSSITTSFNITDNG